MANDITGSCEIGASVELIPDAVDDILPPGYLDEGTLPIDTTEQDIGIDPANGVAITGECAECPEGTVWGCCPEVSPYPEHPPANLFNCTEVIGASFTRNVTKFYTGSVEYFSFPEGTNGVGYNIYDEEFTTIGNLGPQGGGTDNCQMIGSNKADTIFWYNNAVGYDLFMMGFFNKFDVNTQTITTYDMRNHPLKLNVWNQQIGYHQGVIGIAAGQFKVELESLIGIVFYNDDLEYLSHIAGESVGFFINGNAYMYKSASGGTVIMDIYGVGTEILSTKSFVRIVDLGLYDNGMFAGLYNGGVDIFDYDNNFIASLVPPTATQGSFGFAYANCANGQCGYSSPSVQRYGNYIAVGDPLYDLGNTNSGAIHIYRVDGTYIKSVNPYYDSTNKYVGSRIMFSANILGGGGSMDYVPFGTSAFGKYCEYSI